MVDSPGSGHPTHVLHGDQQKQGTSAGVIRAEGPHWYLERYSTERRRGGNKSRGTDGASSGTHPQRLSPSGEPGRSKHAWNAAATIHSPPSNLQSHSLP